MTRVPIGLAVMRPTPGGTIEAVIAAERAGLATVWSTVAGTGPDAVTTFAAAAVQTASIAMGTSIVPAYPRHPIMLASQALVLADLAPGRFRLGVGPSHRPTIEGVFGLEMRSPLTFMREYVTVLRGLLWEGESNFEGEFFTVHASLTPGTSPPRTPVLLSALRPNAFRQAGEIADGAISWVCPVPYLVGMALPALQAGADAAGRSRPPLVAHVPVVMAADGDTARGRGRDYLTRYARLPFYRSMFEVAGFQVGSDGAVPDGLVDDLVVWGDGPSVVKRLQAILDEGLDELLVTVLPVSNADDDERELLLALQEDAS